MNLLPTDEQRQILDALRDVLAAEAPVERLRAHGEVGNPDRPIVQALGGLGFLALALPEAHGGSGLGAAEEMLLAREFGRFLISPAVLAAIGALHLLSEADALPDLRADIAEGRTAIGLANPRDGEQVHLIEAEDAPFLLGWNALGVGLWPRASFVDAVAVRPMDATLALSRARRTAPALVARAGDASARLVARMALLLAAYACGLAEATRDLSVAYAGVREQFGKPIGAFQAVKHKCADMAIRCEAASSQAAFAALVLEGGRSDADFHVTAAKLVAVDAAQRNAAQCLQVHGAFGFTSEAPIHHYLKRAHVIDLVGGDSRELRRRLIRMPMPA